MKYGKAPIVEAILDIRVVPRSEASASELVSVFSGLSIPFTKREEIAAEQRIQISLGPNALAPQVGPVLGGFRYEYAEQSQVVQVQREGFVFSLLPPYNEWEDFVAHAQVFWERYRDVWQPQKITRVALRYVNQFNFPLVPENFNYGAYFTIMPGNFRNGQMPLQQVLDAFSLQLMLPQTDIEGMAILSFGSLPRSSEDTLSVILDIDIFLEGLLMDPNNEALLWESLGKLRQRKNDLFRASITDICEASLEPTAEKS
ncbi:TIGR04255 family protein [Armatimonas sp.]|uniref:TIGR04255 family protein n=1 Tax=Armatimonas sp. TaxID=1872638 RepID=UPI003750D51C